MSYYADMKIRNKLLLGFGSLVGIAFTIGLFGYSQIHLIHTSDTIMYQKGVVPLMRIGNISTDFQRLRSNLRELILVNDKQQIDYYEGRVITFRKKIDSTVKLLEETLPDAESTILFNQLELARSGYTPHLNRIMELTKANKVDEAVVYLNSYLAVEAEVNEINAIETLQIYLVDNAKKISEANRATADLSGKIMFLLACGASLVAAIMAFLITRSVVNPLRISLNVVRQQESVARQRSNLIAAIAAGDFEQEVILSKPLTMESYQRSGDEAGMLLASMVSMSEVQYLLDQAFAEMTSFLRHTHDQEARQDRQKNGLHDLNKILSGDQTTAVLAEDSLSFLAKFLGAGSAALYLAEEGSSLLNIAASYAFVRRKRLNVQIRPGEGVAGQAALERTMICLDRVPAGYLPIGSGTGEADPGSILVMPILYASTLLGVLEFGKFKKFSDEDIAFLNLAAEDIGIAFSVNRSHQKVKDLLQQTLGQAEELRLQQEELQQTNEELEERAQLLEQQREQIRAKNRDIEAASRELQHKAEELERVSAYKSEFLANMSHELRTPLNSMMILSSLLKDNREENLTLKQIEFAATINSAGRDLLNLINDILDLSKIEAGKLDFHYEELLLSEICQQLHSVFIPIASDKEIEFSVFLDQSMPETMYCDSQRTQQILKNLLSNACKFTSKGSFSLRAYTPDAEENPLNTYAVAFAVSDSGIGIPADKLLLIFNAFQQADGSTSRTYGGTGLGLSISRQLARSMGGEITVVSEAGKGSTFVLYLPKKQIGQMGETGNPGILGTMGKPENLIPVNPIIPKSPITEAANTTKAFDPQPSPIPDDRDMLQADSKSILIIEDDLTFAGVLQEMVHHRGFASLVAADGESGIALAEQYRPSAIILDVMLPHIDGWGVMRNLKDNPQTRHIPVHFITCLEERQKAMSMGAIGYVTKPVSSQQLDSVIGTLEYAILKTMKMLLIVEDDKDQAAAMVALLESRNVTITVADSGGKAIQLLTQEPFDCIVLDLGLADMGAFELLEELKKLDPERRTPVIIHTGRELTHIEEKKLRHYAESIIIKGAKSPERLLNEVTLFLHLVETSLDPGKQRMIRAALDKEAMLEGKKILIVDDDMRNIYSLSSALSEKNMQILEAENGHEALRCLDQQPDIDLVLMDIMMPEMDGYEAMRKIREDPRFYNLPIIALTAKAMKGDREECMKAGANDYIPKPVDMEKLFSLLRVWLYKAG